MKERSIEFGVEGVTHANDRAWVIGRIHQGPIRVGDLFAVAFKPIPVHTSEGYAPSIRTGERPISAKVESIHAYGRIFDELEPGMTAKLELSGSDTATLTQGDVIGGTMESKA